MTLVVHCPHTPTPPLMSSPALWICVSLKPSLLRRLQSLPSVPVNCYRIWLSVAQLLPPHPSPPPKGWARSSMPAGLLPCWKGSMLQSIGPPPLHSPTDPQAVAHLSVGRKLLLLPHRLRTF